MDLGALEVQIFASLVLVLGTVFVALVCDFLKGNNEFLRERNIELRVRQQERQRLAVATGVPAGVTAGVSTAAYSAAPAPATVTRPAAVPAARQRRTETRESSRRQPSRWARPEELSEINDLAQRIRSRIDAKPEPNQQAAEETSPEVPEPQRAETAPQPLDITASDVKHAPRKVEPQPEPQPQRPLATPSFTAKVTPIDRLALESSASEALDLAQELARVASLNGGATAEAAKELETVMASAEAEPAVPIEEADHEEPEEAPVVTVPEPVSLPSGMVDRAAFNELMESEQLLSATVMAVGVGGLESAPWEEKSAFELIRSLVEEGDVACRTDEDSFVLIFPNLHGADGQRRISQASQRLWDHQIRSVGRSPIMFSWGATDTAKDKLAAVVESARERMEQTRRNRERAPHKIHQYRVVNR